MRPEGSLPHSQEPATSPYPEPEQSNPCLPSHFLENYFIITLPSTPWFSKFLYDSVFPTKTLFAPIFPYVPRFPPTRSSRFDHPNNILIFGEEYRSLSSSLCSFLHSPVASSLLGPNILLSTLFSNTLSLSLPQCDRPSFTPIQKKGAIL